MSHHEAFGERQDAFRREMSGRIKALRESTGLSTTRFALENSYDQNKFWRWESGKALPDVTEVPRLAKALHCSIAYLVTGREAESFSRASSETALPPSASTTSASKRSKPPKARAASARRRKSPKPRANSKPS